MGRTIKKKSKRKVKMPYDQELNELREWQENQYNPGYYIGTGRTPYPLKRVGNRPKLKFLYLLFVFGPIVATAVLDGIFNGISLLGLIMAASVIGLLAWILYDSRKHYKR